MSNKPTRGRPDIYAAIKLRVSKISKFTSNLRLTNTVNGEHGLSDYFVFNAMDTNVSNLLLAIKAWLEETKIDRIEIIILSGIISSLD